MPCVFLPYPYHKDQHQAANAQPLVDAGGAMLVTDLVEPQANLQRLTPALPDLLAKPQERAQMVRALRNLPRRDGAATCAAALIAHATEI